MPRSISHCLISTFVWISTSSRTSGLIAAPSLFYRNRPSISLYGNPSSRRDRHVNSHSLQRATGTILMLSAHHQSSSSSSVLQPKVISSNHTNLVEDEPSSQSQTTRQNRSIIAHETKSSTSIQNNTPFDLPRHIAFICDGNSRWSRRKSLPESMGHVAGADRVVHIIKTLQQQQQNSPSQKLRQDDNKHEQFHQQRIEYCTLFAFSTENWSRPSSEIYALFKLIEKTANNYRQHEMVREGKIQIEVLGDLEDERIPKGTRKELMALATESKANCNKRKEEATEKDDGNVLTICLAINYGGRADILRAAQTLARSIASGELPPHAPIDESEISKRLCTSHVPDPDLIVRTGGERRLSNFMLWNAAYAELYFSDVLWPDFDGGALEEALVWYGRRKRRFGGRDDDE